MIELSLPEPSLILLLGVAGAGKSTFAHRHFRSTEIVSSDHCRALICDDETEQAVNAAAFDLLHHLTRLRLQWNKLTVIDATNLQAHARATLLQIARLERIPVVAVILNVSVDRCAQQNRLRSRIVPDEILAQHQIELAQARLQLPSEGYIAIFELNESQILEAVVRRQRILPSEKKYLEDQTN